MTVLFFLINERNAFIWPSFWVPTSPLGRLPPSGECIRPARPRQVFPWNFHLPYSPSERNAVPLRVP